jgi:hypothetical protein
MFQSAVSSCTVVSENATFYPEQFALVEKIFWEAGWWASRAFQRRGGSRHGFSPADVLVRSDRRSANGNIHGAGVQLRVGSRDLQQSRLAHVAHIERGSGTEGKWRVDHVQQSQQRSPGDTPSRAVPSSPTKAPFRGREASVPPVAAHSPTRGRSTRITQLPSLLASAPVLSPIPEPWRRRMEEPWG